MNTETTNRFVAGATTSSARAGAKGSKHQGGVAEALSRLLTEAAGRKPGEPPVTTVAKAPTFQEALTKTLSVCETDPAQAQVLVQTEGLVQDQGSVEVKGKGKNQGKNRVWDSADAGIVRPQAQMQSSRSAPRAVRACQSGQESAAAAQGSTAQAPSTTKARAREAADVPPAQTSKTCAKADRKDRPTTGLSEAKAQRSDLQTSSTGAQGCVPAVTATTGTGSGFTGITVQDCAKAAVGPGRVASVEASPRPAAGVEQTLAADPSAQAQGTYRPAGHVRGSTGTQRSEGQAVKGSAGPAAAARQSSPAKAEDSTQGRPAIIDGSTGNASGSQPRSMAGDQAVAVGVSAVPLPTLGTAQVGKAKSPAVTSEGAAASSGMRGRSTSDRVEGKDRPVDDLGSAPQIQEGEAQEVVKKAAAGKPAEFSAGHEKTMELAAPGPLEGAPVAEVVQGGRAGHKAGPAQGPQGAAHASSPPSGSAQDGLSGVREQTGIGQGTTLSDRTDGQPPLGHVQLDPADQHFQIAQPKAHIGDGGSVGSLGSQADPLPVVSPTMGSMSGLTGATMDQINASISQQSVGGNQQPLSEQVFSSIRGAFGSQTHELTVELNPPELGKVLIRLEQHAGQLSGVLEVSNRSTASDLERAMPQVIQNLNDSGIQVRRLDVSLSDQYGQQPKDGTLSDMYQGRPGQQDQGNHSSYAEHRSYPQTAPEIPIASRDQTQAQVSVGAGGSINMLV